MSDKSQNMRGWGTESPDGGGCDGRPRRRYIKDNKTVEEAESRNNRFSVVVFYTHI